MEDLLWTCSVRKEARPRPCARRLAMWRRILTRAWKVMFSSWKAGGTCDCSFRRMKKNPVSLAGLAGGRYQQGTYYTKFLGLDMRTLPPPTMYLRLQANMTKTHQIHFWNQVSASLTKFRRVALASCCRKHTTHAFRGKNLLRDWRFEDREFAALRRISSCRWYHFVLCSLCFFLGYGMEPLKSIMLRMTIQHVKRYHDYPGLILPSAPDYCCTARVLRVSIHIHSMKIKVHRPRLFIYQMRHAVCGQIIQQSIYVDLVYVQHIIYFSISSAHGFRDSVASI